MRNNLHLSVVILAAGKGTRMKSDKAKVLHEVFYRPMVHHVLDAVSPMKPSKTVVIVGHQEKAVRQALTEYDVEIVRQEQQLGTGHAVLMAKESLCDDEALVLILCGDTPLIGPDSLQAMLDHHIHCEAELTLMTTKLDNPFGYGRIISSGRNVQAIVEEKECDHEQRKIREINAGIYLVEKKLLFEALETITPDNTQGEFYLTDIVEYGVGNGRKVEKFLNSDPIEVLGVNSRVELESAHRVLQKKRNTDLMREGVSFHNSDTVSISLSSSVGKDCQIMQNCQVLGSSTVGRSCILESGAIIRNCTLGDNVTVGAYSVLENCTIETDSRITPLSVVTSDKNNQ